ncbi:COQ7 protein [Uncinocarpus reesii 1704]|uniref:5-demethoxyubiquinone hydroxylase, mitochondrial n=1 Tax=Uncinocarpus reesii (strain UAMH 1704) TaxID=336963 RepID=C4JWW5_UNCRE|nr:COQ7 protein [Uncinocarpus reesii 1704]EEP81273.1 COQ7 protein [Uncinocarpus reesii 1704]
MIRTAVAADSAASAQGCSGPSTTQPIGERGAPARITSPETSHGLEKRFSGLCLLRIAAAEMDARSVLLGHARLWRAGAFSSSICSRCLRASQPPVRHSSVASSTRPRMVLTQAQRDFLDSALRVNQAGELAATHIYTAQSPPVVRSHPHLRPLMKHMYDQEAGHFDTFNNLIAKHRVRPTVMYPIWQGVSSFLGWSTGIMGREAAMACTEAVETEIGTHYNDQIRVMLEWFADAEQRGEEIDGELRELVTTLKRIRDEELEHLDHAVENDAKEAKPYDPLVNVIRLGCRAAIKITEKI